MLVHAWLSLLLLGSGVCAYRSHRDHERNDYFALHLHDDVSPSEIARLLKLHYEGPLGELPGHFTFSSPKHSSSRVEDTLQNLKRRRLRRKRSNTDKRAPTRDLDGILWSEKQVLRQRLVKRVPSPQIEEREKGGANASDDGETDQAQQEAIQKLNTIATTLDIQDPIFKEQWHLFNPLQLGHDLNVTGVWLDGITGNGTIAAVIDDGLDMYSDDLKPNYYAAGSWDYNENLPEPKPLLFDDKHGTRCAGEIAAAKNNVCGVGMAYDGKVSGVRILSKPITDEDEALAMNHHFQENQIFSCSWGPPDDGQSMEAPGLLIQKAMVNGIQKGRQGLGSVYVFAAGNGAASEDNCNFDGYTNSIYSITVGGIDRAGNHPYYSESCSAQLVVTYSSGHNDAIHTTDVGENKCYSGHGGTSAAGPLVAGTVALALSIRPDLTWRDMQYLVVDTAVPIHLDDGDWQDTKIGKKFSHMFGYGKMDAYRFVEAAKVFKSVKPQAWYRSPWLNVQHPIPQGDKGLAASYEVTADMLKEANLERLEHVTVTMNVEHQKRGDLSVEMRSPEGVVSHIATTRRNDASTEGYDDWTFMSVAYWGESGIGKWEVIVKDTLVNEHNGTFIDWRLNLWGESIDASIQELLPLPDEHDDDHVTEPAIISTASVNPGVSTELPATPTDHPERPTKPKPSESEAVTTSTAISLATTTNVQTATATSQLPTATHTYSDSFLPSFFPTFGVSKKTQIWIYSAMGMIIAFCIGLGAYAFIQRRKRRLNNPRDDYEFEMVPDDAGDEHTTGGKGRNRQKRGGELYDAFAGESDDEILSDDEGYQDIPPSNSGSHDSGNEKARH